MYLLAHATRKPTGPTNLLREKDNQTDNSITQVMKKEVDQLVPLQPTWHNLSANIIRIFNRRHMPNEWFSHSSRIAYCMVANGV
jgi:hypothetical protein